jgi:hypothetical protein
MFTDSPATPLRLEALLEVLRAYPRLKVETLKALLSPDGLPEKEGVSQAADTVLAAKELNLITEESGFVTASGDRTTPIRHAVLQALDLEVLGNATIEPYFAAFYSFLLGLPESGTTGKSRDVLANNFNRVVYRDNPPANRFNPTKMTGLMRWYHYAGLGWNFPKDSFQCSPVARLGRTLELLFGEQRRLAGDTFLEGIARHCPELDGGAIFIFANPSWDPTQRQCTTGLAHALIALHEDERIRLHCAPDSRGWSIERAEPPDDANTLRSARIDEVELLPHSKGTLR